MADTTTRTLRLLSLLQRRRHWPGPELADQLDVSDRTLRRDIDRLRTLGYTVESERGVDGGYRLAGAAGDAVLLLDDDEATALAVSLHRSSAESSEFAQASLGALTKVLSMLRPEQRERAEAVRATTDVSPRPTTTAPPLSVLDALATACRDQVRLSFDYVAADETPTSRYVEPHQIVVVGSRWYLVAHDNDRNDWRTFRVDRISSPTPARNTFPSRPAPARDLQHYVRSNIRGLNQGHRVVVEADIGCDKARRLYGPWVEVDDLGGKRSRLIMDADSFLWPTHIVAALEAPFIVIEPPEFEEHLALVAERLTIRPRRTGHDR